MSTAQTYLLNCRLRFPTAYSMWWSNNHCKPNVSKTELLLFSLQPTSPKLFSRPFMASQSFQWLRPKFSLILTHIYFICKFTCGFWIHNTAFGFAALSAWSPLPYILCTWLTLSNNTPPVKTPWPLVLKFPPQNLNFHITLPAFFVPIELPLYNMLYNLLIYFILCPTPHIIL